MSILIDRNAKRHRMKPGVMRKLFFFAVLASASFAGTARAEPVAEYPSAVSAFSGFCLMNGVDPNDRIRALENASGWTEDTAVTVDIPQMEVSPAISRNYRFKEVEAARQWSGTIDGAPARIVLASFEGEQRYKNLCAITMEGAKNAMPYGDELKEAFKAYGIKGKSVDLVHYYEFSGKVGPEKHPARGEIFTRSRSGDAKETMHIYLAY